MQEFCNKFGITESQFSGQEKIGGSLYLSGLTTIPDGFNPTVGGSLYLRGLTTIPAGFDPTVGGYLYLSGSLTATTTSPTTDFIFWEGGKYVKADGIFTEVVRKIGNVYVVRKLNTDKEFFLVTDLAFTHAHGYTIEKAAADFRFKVESERLKHEPVTFDTVITIDWYRAITGACGIGINDWIEQNIPVETRPGVIKNGILVRDLLPILEKTGAYGLSKFKALIQGQ